MPLNITSYDYLPGATTPLSADNAKRYFSVAGISEALRKYLLSKGDRLKYFVEIKGGSFVMHNCGIMGLYGINSGVSGIGIEVDHGAEGDAERNEFLGVTNKLVGNGWGPSLLTYGRTRQETLFAYVRANTTALFPFIMEDYHHFAGAFADALDKGTSSCFWFSDNLSPKYNPAVSGPRTRDFAEFLAKSKRGLLQSTPVMINGMHNVPGDYFSYIQAWTWIPPSKVQLAVRPPTVRRVFTKLPTVEEFVPQRLAKLGDPSRAKIFEDNLRGIDKYV